jgi:hypothetical protein
MKLPLGFKGLNVGSVHIYLLNTANNIRDFYEIYDFKPICQFTY